MVGESSRAVGQQTPPPEAQHVFPLQLSHLQQSAALATSLAVSGAGYGVDIRVFFSPLACVAARIHE